jgi:excisionase family DNA binding protein
MPTELLTPGELADRLKVTRATITKWRKLGRIPFLRVNATVYRFDYEAVLEALRAEAETITLNKIQRVRQGRAK